MSHCRLLAWAVTVALLGPGSAWGATFPNLTYFEDELLEPLAYFDRDNMPCDEVGTPCPAFPNGPTGSNTVVVVDGYLIVMGSLDSGKLGGPLHVFDISDPRSPVRITTVADVATAKHREVHALPLAVVDERTYLAIPVQPQGINFWELTDPTHPTLVGSIQFSSRSGDYDNTVWQLTWGWPYLFAAGTGDGVYVVDATEPSSPQFVSRIATSTFGGARVGPLLAVGNLLVGSNMAQDPSRVTVVDVADPRNPFQLATGTGPAKQYSTLVIGERIFTVGVGGTFGFWSWSEEKVEFLEQVRFGSAKGGYCTFQDVHLFCGQSEQGMRKINVENLGEPFQVANAVYSRPEADHDFATVLGNLVFMGNDHGSGSAIVPHQIEPDDVAPVPLRSYPPDGATQVILRPRLTTFFSDVPAVSSVNGDTVFLRNLRSCQVVEGGRSLSSVNAVTFAPVSDLEADTTYELVFGALGVSDAAGNALQQEHTVRFSTGATLSMGTCDEPDGGTTTPGESGVEQPPSVAAFDVSLVPLKPALVGSAVGYSARVVGGEAPLSFAWRLEGCGVDGATEHCVREVDTPSPELVHAFDVPGHHSVTVLVSDASGHRVGASALQTVHMPATSVAPTHSTTITFDKLRNTVWNINQDDDSVSATAIGALQAPPSRVAVGRQPRAIAQAPNGELWVTNQSSDSITVVDPDTKYPRATIALPRGSQPYGIAFDPTRGTAWVTLYATGTLVEIDPTTRRVVRQLRLGPSPAAIAISSRSTIYVTRFISPDTHGLVWQVDAETLSRRADIVLPFDIGQDDGDPATNEDPDWESGGRGVPNYLAQVTISPDGTRAWVLAKKDNIARGPMRDGRAMTADSFVRAVVCVVDLQTGRELVEQRIDLDNRSLPVAAEFSPLGDYVYVLTQGSKFLGIHDAYNPSQHLGGIQQLGAAPDGLVVTPDKLVLVNGNLSRSVLAYDLTRSIDVGDHRVEAAVAEIPVSPEPLDAEVAAGKRLFHDASDARMSEHGYLACVVCHYGGANDGRTWDFTDRGEGLRNTPSLVGIGTEPRVSYHWSGNFDEVQDFERDIRESFGGSGFMSETAWASQTHAGPFGARTSGLSYELDALAAYLASLRNLAPSPYRNEDGTLTSDGMEGKRIFERAGCAACHLGSSRSDGLPHDVGTFVATSGMRLHGELTGLVTPTLNGLWMTAPYLHDGRARSLSEIFTLYNLEDGMGATSELSTREVQQLVAYLLQIDGSPEGSLGATNGEPVAAADATTEESETVLVESLPSTPGGSETAALVSPNVGGPESGATVVSTDPPEPVAEVVFAPSPGVKRRTEAANTVAGGGACNMRKSGTSTGWAWIAAVLAMMAARRRPSSSF